jgi:hypothetical protein
VLPIINGYLTQLERTIVLKSYFLFSKLSHKILLVLIMDSTNKAVQPSKDGRKQRGPSPMVVDRFKEESEQQPRQQQKTIIHQQFW